MPLPAIPAGLYVEAWPPMLAVRGPGLYWALHAHHAMHFVLAVEGELRVRTSSWTMYGWCRRTHGSGHSSRRRRLWFRAGHCFRRPGERSGCRAPGGTPRTTSTHFKRRAAELIRGVESPESFARADAHEWIRRAATALGLTLQESTPVLHSVVRKLLARLRKSGLEDDMSLEGLADAVGLSPGRLMHVFTESVGIPLCPYLAWLRVQRSACAILSGASVTDAAHLAGFADVAHMSRTFKRKLGLPPSALRLMHVSEPVQAVRN